MINGRFVQAKPDRGRYVCAQAMANDICMALFLQQNRNRLPFTDDTHFIPVDEDFGGFKTAVIIGSHAVPIRPRVHQQQLVATSGQD